MKKITFFDSFYELTDNDLIDIFSADKENILSGGEIKDNEIDLLESHYIETNPDFVFNDNGDVENTFIYHIKDKQNIDNIICINLGVNNEGDISFTDKSIKAIEKYFNDEDEYDKYLNETWDWDLIKSKKDKDVYTVAERGGSGYTYRGGFYKV